MFNETEYNKTIASNLKHVATLRGKTQTDISRDLNIAKGTVSCWFTARSCPRLETIDRLCSYLACTRADIMEERKPHDLEDEVIVARAYRNADEVTKEMVRRVLGVKGGKDAESKEA